jgi:hypothetical protein
MMDDSSSRRILMAPQKVNLIVTPAQAGNHLKGWIPAFAGMKKRFVFKFAFFILR